MTRLDFAVVAWLNNNLEELLINPIGINTPNFSLRLVSFHVIIPGGSSDRTGLARIY